MASMVETCVNEKENTDTATSEMLSLHQHSGMLQCCCGHELGQVPFPLDASYIHAKGQCFWTCCSESWDVVKCSRAPVTPGAMARNNQQPSSGKESTRSDVLQEVSQTDAVECRQQAVSCEARASPLGSSRTPNSETRQYRGIGWDHVVNSTPHFNAYTFLPTAPAVKPRTRSETLQYNSGEENESTDADEEEVDSNTAPELSGFVEAGASDVDNSPAIDEAISRELRYEPPSDVDLLFTIRDRYGDYRGYIDREGTCVNNCAEIIGYINTEEGTAGSKDEEFLGCCMDQLVGDECVIEDSLDDRCGSIHLGSSRIIDNQASTVAEFDANGNIVGNHGSSLGSFEGFSYEDIRVVALYLMLIDPGMLNEVEG